MKKNTGVPGSYSVSHEISAGATMIKSGFLYPLGVHSFFRYKVTYSISCKCTMIQYLYKILTYIPSNSV